MQRLGSGEPASKLVASIVTYRSSLPALSQTLACLQQAGERAVVQGLIDAVQVALIDNASGQTYREKLQALAADFRAAGLQLELILRADNGGYAQGHNAVGTAASDFRLVLNPDAFLDPDSLTVALGFLKEHPEVGLVAPQVLDRQGRLAGLYKRYPSVLVLGLRGLAPAWLRKRLAGLLAEYEVQAGDFRLPRFAPEVASGCCLLMRGWLWQQIGGFDPGYFLYFEDFDLVLRARQLAKIACVAEFRLIHLGGGAARKGLRHQGYFVRSAIRFFNRYGWRWI